MAIYYVDFLSGSDTTGNGTSALPFQTVNFCLTAANTEVRVAKTELATTFTCSVSWTYNSLSLTTGTDMTSSISIGDYIGKPTAAGNGAVETYYRVNAINATTITLDNYYYGTTEVLSTFKKIPVVITGALNTNSITFTYATCTMSGGWNLGGASPIQDGETWFKPNGARTTYIAINFSVAQTANISKLNMVECYAGVSSMAGGASTLTNLTILAYYRSIYASGGSGFILRDSVLSITAAGSEGIYVHAIVPGLVENCAFLGTGSYGINAVGTSTLEVKNNIFFKKTHYMGAATNLTPGSTFTGTNKFYYCVCGVYTGSYSLIIDGCEFYNCVNYGILTGNQAPAPVIKNCSFIDSPLGIYSQGQHGMLVDGCNFIGCTKGIYIDIGSGDMELNNCYFSAIGTACIDRVANAGTTIINNSVMSPYVAGKTYVVTTTTTYNLAQYILNNAFGEYGTVYGFGSKTYNYSVYRTTAPSIAIQTNAALTLNQKASKVLSTMINSGASATFGFYMKSANASWSGSLLPKWRLNGNVIKTESTAVTSVSTGWMPYSWSCASSYITANGELSLEFIPNMNTYAIYLDDFTVT